MSVKRLILFVFLGVFVAAGCGPGESPPATVEVPKEAPPGQGGAATAKPDALKGEAADPSGLLKPPGVDKEGVAPSAPQEAGEPAAKDPALAQAADPAGLDKAADPAVADPALEGAGQGDPPPATPSGPGQITFKQASPKVGAVMTEVTGSDMLMDMNLTILGTPKAMKSEEKSSERRQVTVLATKGDAITKIKVRYEEKTRLQKQTGQASPDQMAPVVGKTYTVESKEGAVVLLDEAGKPASPEELRIVENDFEGFGQADQFAALLPKGAMKVGDKIDLTADVVRQLMRVGQELMEFSEVSFVLKAVKDVGGQMAGVFELLMKIAVKPGPGMSIQMAMKGEVVIRAEGWLSSFTIEGPITVVADKALEDKMKIDGSGKIKFTKAVTY